MTKSNNLKFFRDEKIKKLLARN